MKNGQKYFIVCSVMLLLCAENAVAQNTTSPYSILGIGDIETKDFGRWYGMGSTSIALSSLYYINASNPASLTELDERMMTLDLANRGKSARFRYASTDTFTATTKDFSVRRISLAFKPNKHWAFSIGLKPYSTINYLLNESNVVYNNASVLSKQIDGSGGLNQFYFSYARKINKKLSVGLTSSYYFGSANIKTSYYGTALSTTLDKQQYNIMNAFQFQFGLQYAAKISATVSHRFGFTLSNPAPVKQRTETEYFSSDVSIKKTEETKKDFKLPLSAGIGYAIVFDNRLTISADAVFNNWNKQEVDYPNSYTAPSGRLSAGFEYVNRKRINNLSFEDWYVQGGASVENNYIKIQNKNMYSYAFSAGFGKNLSRLLSVYGGYEYGIKGNQNNNQITERFSQYILGVTLKEFWFNFKKYGRYQ